MNVKFNFLFPVSTRSSSFAVNADISSATLGYAKAAANAATLIDAALATDTASGAIASFSDGAEGLAVKSLTLNVEPSQSGSGDPSPSNVRPISGHTGVTVTRTGKNLAKLLGVGIYNTSTGIVAPASSSTYAYSDKVACAPSTTYSISAGYTITQALVYYWGADGAFISASTMGGSGNKTFTSIANADMMAIAVRRGESTSSLSDFPNVQLELGSTATAYEPYTAETYPITFPDAAGTVYGGTVDVTTGKLKVTKASTILTGSNNWSIENGGMRIKTSDLADVIQHNSANNTTIGAICNMFEEKTPNQTWAGGSSGIGVSVAPNGDVAFCQTGEQSMGWSAWINFVNSNTLQLVYPLATPIEYDLTPEQITTLKGCNNIWSDSGTTEVEYYCDTKLYVQKMIAAALNA